MRQVPLGLDSEVWKRRNETQKNTFGKHKSWKLGYEAGKRGESKTSNPYSIPEDTRKLLRQRAYWELGREEGVFTPSKRIKAKHTHDELKHIKELVKPKHKHHKHKEKHGKHK
jgi:hypothetical protein